MREVVFDTETTGLSVRDGHRVIEIGAIELINQFPSGKIFHAYINPGDKKVDAGAFDVHGISNEQLAGEPTFDGIVEEFMAFFAEGNLIAHNASFDTGFLNAELARLKLPPLPQDRIIDTLQIAKRKHPAGPNSLDALCSRYNIDASRRTKHGALLDSELLAEVYLELTGGRQAALGFTNDTVEDMRRTDANSTPAVKTSPRPVPLPSRLTAEEREAHELFVETLGKNSTWNRLAK